MTWLTPNSGAIYVELWDFAAVNPWKVICYLTVRDIVCSLFFLFPNYRF